MFAVAEARGTLDTLNLDGSVATESADSSITISLKQWPVEAAEFTDFLSSRTVTFTVLAFFPAFDCGCRRRIQRGRIDFSEQRACKFRKPSIDRKSATLSANP